MHILLKGCDLWKQYQCLSRKAFGFKKDKITALKGVSLTVEKGRLTAIIGLNGAGKTTLCKILCGIMPANRGRIFWQDRDTAVQSALFKQNMGFVSGDERGFYNRLTARQNLEFFAGLYGMNRIRADARIAELSEIFGVDKVDERFSDYSSGHKQRLALIRGLLHDPRLLIIDEPARNLDYIMREKLMHLIKQKLVFELGTTVVIGTNKLEGLEICDKLILLSKGVVKAQGSLDELARASGKGGGIRDIFEHYAV